MQTRDLLAAIGRRRISLLAWRGVLTSTTATCSATIYTDTATKSALVRLSNTPLIRTEGRQNGIDLNNNKQEAYHDL